MAVSKVEYGNRTLIDLTGDTVTASDLLKGVTAHGADGEPIVGNVVVPTKISQLENDSGLVAENLLKYPYTYSDEITVRGTRFTVNTDDRSITLNTESTNTSQPYYNVNKMLLRGGHWYTISGNKLGDGTFVIVYFYTDDTYTDTKVPNGKRINPVDGSEATMTATYISTYLLSVFYESRTFYLAEDTYTSFQVRIPAKASVSNVTVYPLLEYGKVAHRYAPYSLSRQSLREDIPTKVSQLENDNYYPIENYLPLPYYDPSGTTKSGITFTYDSDGVITANGTATSVATLYLSYKDYRTNKYVDIPSELIGKTITLSDAEYTEDSEIRIDFYNENGSSVGNCTAQTGSCTYTIPATARKWQIQLRVLRGTTVSNRVYKPMISLGSVTHEYVAHSAARQPFKEHFIGLIPLSYGSATVNSAYCVSSGGVASVHLEVTMGSEDVSYFNQPLIFNGLPAPKVDLTTLAYMAQTVSDATTVLCTIDTNGVLRIWRPVKGNTIMLDWTYYVGPLGGGLA